MMVIKLEKNRKIIKPREFDNVEDTLEKAILETLNVDCDLIRIQNIESSHSPSLR